MARHSLFETEDKTEINLSSMIDCIFILLIFFIVTTVFVEEKGLQVNKPDASASVSLDKNENLTFQLTADNKLRFEEREILLSDVPNLVQSRLEDPETPVVIQAHEKSDHGVFMALWDAAKRGGAEMLSFSTVN